MRLITGKPFVAAPSEVNGRMHSGDENALIALHKMRTRMRKAWLRAQGLNGFFDEPRL